MSIRFAAPLLVVIVILAGCGKDANQVELSRVTGVVTLGDAPLSGATVIFIPIPETKGTGAEGRTDKDGRYQLKYRDGGDGAPPGEYKVIIIKYVAPDGSDMRDTDLPPIETGAKQLVPASYSDPDHTTLLKTVPSGGTAIDFPLKK